MAKKYKLLYDDTKSYIIDTETKDSFALHDVISFNDVGGGGLKPTEKVEKYLAWVAEGNTIEPADE